MRIVIQRVSEASVTVDAQITGAKSETGCLYW
jgi:D-Tyr-tRNAtyr deacylase